MPAHPPLGLVEIEPAVVVKVVERDPKPGKRTSHDGKTGSGGRVLKIMPFITKERIRLISEIHHEQIGIAIIIDIRHSDAHACLGLTIAIHGTAQQHRLIVEDAVALVDPELVVDAVVGDEDIDPAVAVEVSACDTQAVAVGAIEPSLDGDIGEGPVAVVVVEGVASRVVVGIRIAILAFSGL